MNKSDRVLSSIIDFFAIVLLSVPFIVVDFVLIYNNYTDFEYLNVVAIVFISTTFVCKDVIFDISLGKRMFGLRIVSFNSKNQLKLHKYILRNVTYFLWPLELMFMLADRGRRIGDMLFGTQVVRVKDLNQIERKSFSFGVKMISFVVVFLIQLIIFLSIMFFLESNMPVFKLL